VDQAQDKRGMERVGFSGTLLGQGTRFENGECHGEPFPPPLFPPFSPRLFPFLFSLSLVLSPVPSLPSPSPFPLLSPLVSFPSPRFPLQMPFFSGFPALGRPGINQKGKGSQSNGRRARRAWFALPRARPRLPQGEKEKPRLLTGADLKLGGID